MWPPTTIMEVRQFAGLCGYYSLEKTFSDIIMPIIALTRKKVPFEWTKECQHLFENSKQKTNDCKSLSISRSK